MLRIASNKPTVNWLISLYLLCFALFYMNDNNYIVVNFAKIVINVKLKYCIKERVVKVLFLFAFEVVID